jgi:hypothetical protein
MPLDNIPNSLKTIIDKEARLDVIEDGKKLSK